MISNNIREAEEREIINYVCWKYARFNLLAMLKYLDYKGFIKFLDVFSGCYMKIPPTAKILRLLDRYRLYKSYLRYKEAWRKNDLKSKADALEDFNKCAAKAGLKPSAAKVISKNIENELIKANKWFNKLSQIERKQC